MIEGTSDFHLAQFRGPVVAFRWLFCSAALRVDHTLVYGKTLPLQKIQGVPSPHGPHLASPQGCSLCAGVSQPGSVFFALLVFLMCTQIFSSHLSSWIPQHHFIPVRIPAPLIAQNPLSVSGPCFAFGEVFPVFPSPPAPPPPLFLFHCLMGETRSLVDSMTSILYLADVSWFSGIVLS